jgi:predicted RNA-binding protein YlxR (DUF448 family)
MCAACREVKGKDELLRVVKQKDNVLLDIGGKMAGRGAYICKNESCIQKARKTRALERSLSCKVDQSVYDALEAMQNGGE